MKMQIAMVQLEYPFYFKAFAIEYICLKMKCILITVDISALLLMRSSLQVVRKWRSLASRLGLSAYILDIDCYRGNKGDSSSDYMRRKRNRRIRDKDKMDLLLQTWKSIKPECYTISTLKGILSSEVKSKSMKEIFNIYGPRFQDKCQDQLKNNLMTS